jgi:hypothetical protein
MPYRANEPRRHRIPKVRYKIDNWAEYDAALHRRGNMLTNSSYVASAAQSSGGGQDCVYAG